MEDRNYSRTQQLIEEVIHTFRQLRIVSSQIHGSGLPIPGQRGVLMQLNNGTHTVPEMARDRGVSRQNIQKIVDGFLARGLVDHVANAAHRRSKFIRLTPKGRAIVNAMIAHESSAVRRLRLKVSVAGIEKTILVLQTLRHQLKENWPPR